MSLFAAISESLCRCFDESYHPCSLARTHNISDKCTISPSYIMPVIPTSMSKYSILFVDDLFFVNLCTEKSHREDGRKKEGVRFGVTC